MEISTQRCIQLTLGFFICIVNSIYLDTSLIQSHIRKTFEYIRDFTSIQSKKEEEKPWFMKNGSHWPSPAKIDDATGRREIKLWPNEDPDSDRIINQFMFVPPKTNKTLPIKKVLMWYGMIYWETKHPKGSAEPFKTCPVSNCMALTNRARALKADAILFLNQFNHNAPTHRKPSHQVWIMYTMESPLNTELISREDAFNWTATYMQSSDIVRNYGKWVYYDQSKTEWNGPPRNFAAGKTKKVAWFVSNCNRHHNNRWSYAQQLGKYIQVDIYGECGKLKCSQSNKHAGVCFELLDNQYKFYLAFENSNCREYITEKFFFNGLQHKVIPVVMGAPREDYERVAPKGSFIHVEDFDSPEHLAIYLHKLDLDDDLYNSYFKWKGMGEVLENYFYCRLCAMLNDDFPDKYYPRFSDFWRKPGSCIEGSWPDYKRRIGGQLPSVSAIEHF
ncbi:hypothetical protein LSTR_LSTR004080 [Laodelphax striatellus]|uniref:Fucosyltransferase n=1 Tax=Laodelphax striatellus TaxID=195883 RepID=A0A482WHA0_LAOST|nr:hypothetical protein LSTR_LSTR004080 [Laodelphax striatellus]